MTGEAVDLYHWQPDEHYDAVVASLYQMPVDPYEEPTAIARWTTGAATCSTTSSRLLPQLLAEGGGRSSCSSRSSASSARRALLEAGGFTAASSTSLLPVRPAVRRNGEQIARVEELSDAYHLRSATRT